MKTCHRQHGGMPMQRLPSIWQQLLPGQAYPSHNQGLSGAAHSREDHQASGRGLAFERMLPVWAMLVLLHMVADAMRPKSHRLPGSCSQPAHMALPFSHTLYTSHAATCLKFLAGRSF